jgi:hypothetical protein
LILQKLSGLGGKEMISPTGGMIRSGNGYGYGRYTFSLSKNDSFIAKIEKNDFQMIKKPIKSVVSRLVKLISSFNKEVGVNDLSVKLDENAPSGFVTMFTLKNSRKKA